MITKLGSVAAAPVAPSESAVPASDEPKKVEKKEEPKEESEDEDMGFGKQNKTLIFYLKFY